jgi:hypothetical protein
VPRGLQVIEKELQTQVHPSAARPNPVAQKWKKNLKLYSPKTLPIPAVPWGFRFIYKNLQSRALQTTIGSYTVASNSFTHTCKHEPINQLLVASEFVERFDRQNPHRIIESMRIWIEPGRGSPSIISVAFFGISSVAISSDSIVLRFASLPDSYALNYNATSNPNYDLKIVKLTFALTESRKKLEMEP